MFIPFTVDAFGILVPNVVELVKNVQQVMHNNVMSRKSMDVVFFNSFDIHKKLASQLVSPFPFT